MNTKDDHSVAVVAAPFIRTLLEGDRRKVIELVGQAYATHSAGQSINPDSHFLHLEKQKARIIALPAYLGGETERAGLKWIASFPSNIEQGIARASAVVVLNSLETGQPLAILEGSLISAHRTAAIAAIGTRVLSGDKKASSGFKKIAVIGAGVIAREIVRYITDDGIAAQELAIFDLKLGRSQALRTALECDVPALSISVATSLEDAADAADLVIFATTAGEPYLIDVALFGHAPCILNISLRDLGVDIICASENYFDDVEHALKASTSAHLAERATGARNFVNGTLHDVLSAKIVPDLNRTRIFSPFGLGVLDIALAHHCYAQAIETDHAYKLPNFLPSEWVS